VQGELVIGGPFVSRGYLNREELTADRFGSRTFAAGDRWSYKTGDLASVRVSDGMLDFHGRVDHQVKIRGHRIELGEIEAALDSLAGIQQSIVCVNPSRPNELVAFFVSSTGGVEAERLQIALGETLPAIMVPSRFVRLEHFPMTTSNKVDRVLLTSGLADPDGFDGEATGLGSGDPLADMVHDYAVVLGRADVSPDTDFFGSGGHSLLAVELMSRIAARTGTKLGIRALLEASTPRALAELVRTDSSQASAESSLVHFLGPLDGDRTLYLVHGAAGNVLRLRDLALGLANDICVVGIQAYGAEGHDQPDQTLEQMVDRYVEAIRADSPDGPYELGGYSSGGTIALHVANRLQEQGCRIRSLVLLDSVDSTFHPPTRLEQFRSLLHNAIDRPNLSLVDWARGSVIGWRRRSDWDQEGFELTQRLGFVDLFDHIAHLVESSPAPAPVQAPALLVRSSVENPLNRRVYDVAYRTPQSVRTTWVAEKHDELLRPHTIREIAQHVRDFLRVN
jgi:pimeloyl-ACP methyl ester carboxylesterase